MPRAVKFDRYGGIDVLRIVEVDRPVPGPEQVIIRMKAAGINPGEAAIREGPSPSSGPLHSHRDRVATLPASSRQSETRSGTSRSVTRLSDSRTIGPVTPNWLLSRLTIWLVVPPMFLGSRLGHCLLRELLLTRRCMPSR